MSNKDTIERLSKKYATSLEEFIQTGSINMLREKRRKLQIERLEILARYQINTVSDLNELIKSSSTPEHPGWEDLIEIQNIEAEIKEIESDIKALRAA